MRNLETVKTIDELFLLWREARPEYIYFSNDGVIGNEKLWQRTNLKIAFLLKESNDDFIEIRKELYYEPKKGTSRLFWRNLNMWKYIATELSKDRECTFAETKEEKEKPVTQIAYINIKKNAECKPASYDPDIFSYIDRDWEFLNRQIEIIAPNILFCCGTFKYLKGKIKFECVSERVYSYHNFLAVDFCHPSARNSYKSNFELLHKIFSLIPEKYRQRN
jgi:hypothetical protein